MWFIRCRLISSWQSQVCRRICGVYVKKQVLLVLTLITSLVVFASSCFVYRSLTIWYSFNIASIASDTQVKTDTFVSPNNDKFIVRDAKNGEWYTQTRPFPLHVYSAFYDNRSSLLDAGPRLSVVAVFGHKYRRIRRCLVWFAGEPRDSDAVSVPADVHSVLWPIGRLITCKLSSSTQATSTHWCHRCRPQVPVSVALDWGGIKMKNKGMGVTRTAFRVPVEIPGQYYGSTAKYATNHSVDGLVVCVSSGFGHINPNELVEWLEMQSLLGVSRIVIYNRSLSSLASHALYQYIEGQRLNGRLEIEVRRTAGRLLSSDYDYQHQTSTINDCMYRHINAFRYIAIYDLDELIVPRRWMTIPEMLRSISTDKNLTVGEFAFRDAQFYVDSISRPAFASLKLNCSQNGISCAKFTSSRSSSALLQNRKRKPVSPIGYISKSIVDAKACVMMWVHRCLVFTELFSHRQMTSAFQRMDVDPSDGLKHHYRKCDGVKVHSGTPSIPGICRRDVNETDDIVDDIMLKYADKLQLRPLARMNSSKVLL